MANLLPALEGLNQLLMKQVDEKKVKDKQIRGANLISEYKTRLDQAQSSEEVSNINSWLLKESQVRDAEDVQQTAYYMLNNYGKKFEEKEKEEKKKIELSQDRQGMMDFFKNVPVLFDGKRTTGDVVARSMIEKNENIKTDDIFKVLSQLQIEDTTTVGYDPNSRTIITTTESSTKAGGIAGRKSTSIKYGNGRLFTDEEGSYKDKTGKVIKSQAGIYDEGVDKLIDTSEILGYKGGQQALNAMYEIENPAPIRRGGGGGGYGGGKVDKEEKMIESYAYDDKTFDAPPPLKPGEKRFAWKERSDFKMVEEAILASPATHDLTADVRKSIFTYFQGYLGDMQQAKKHPIGSSAWKAAYITAQKVFWNNVDGMLNATDKEGNLVVPLDQRKNVDRFLKYISK